MSMSSNSDTIQPKSQTPAAIGTPDTATLVPVSADERGTNRQLQQ